MRIRRRPHRTEDLTDTKDRVHILQALHDALLRWPEVSALGFAAESPDDFLSGLQELLGIDHLQARAVSDMQIRRLPSNERASIARNLTDLKQRLEEAS